MHKDFYNQIQDIVEVGLARYKDKYSKPYRQKCPFVLYEKYSRRDVSFLMDCGKDLSSTMYGMKKINDDVFIEGYLNSFKNDIFVNIVNINKINKK